MSLDESLLPKRAVALARAHYYDKEHSEQVARLACMLFDELRELHGLRRRQRILLKLAGLLHDIGLVKNAAKHHKTGRDIILASQRLGLPIKDKTIVALCVRYHRRARPKKTHACLRRLDPATQKTVRRLAALIRIADGLDRTHLSLAHGLRCQIDPDIVTIRVVSKHPSIMDRLYGKKKSDLFEAEFKKSVVIDW